MSSTPEQMFVTASRVKLRFPSTRGEISTEELWDLPLEAKNGFDLDSVAKAVNADMKQSSEDSFVRTKANPAAARAAFQLEIVKYVISVKQQEATAAEQRRIAASKRQVLMAALARKEDATLESMSVDELRAQLAELDANPA